MADLHKINVNLSEGQKKKLQKAYRNKKEISIRLKNSDLNGNDTLLVPANTVKRIEKSKSTGKGALVKISRRNIRKQTGEGIFSSILPVLRNVAPTIGKTLGLSALAGLATEGARQVVKKISGGQIFRVPNTELHKLAMVSDLLNKTQIRDLAKAYNNGMDMRFKITDKQVSNGIGTILASIGIPVILDALKGRGVGEGGPRIGKGGPRIGLPPNPPPFIGTWREGGPRIGRTRVRGKKKSPD